jgi:hypothetical protein
MKPANRARVLSRPTLLHQLRLLILFGHIREVRLACRVSSKWLLVEAGGDYAETAFFGGHLPTRASSWRPVQTTNRRQVISALDMLASQL